MKKTLSLMAAITLAVALHAQVGTLNVRAEGKGLAVSSFQSYCYSLDTSSLLFEQNPSAINSRYELVRFNMNLKEQVRTRYKRQMGRSYEYAFDNGSVIDMLISDRGTGDTPVGLYHERRDPATLQPLSDPVPLYTIRPEAGEGFAFARLSPDKQLVAGFYVTVREDQQTEVRVALYNRQLDEYWDMTTRITTFGPMLVTDSGEVIIAGCSKKAGSNELDYEVIVLDGERDATYRFSTHYIGRVSDLQLGNYHGGRISLFATISKEGHESENETCVDRLLSLCYDISSKKLYEEVYALTRVDCNRLCNKDDGAGAVDGVRFLQLENVASAADGRYDILLTQRWTQFTDGLPDGFFTQGLMVASVDANGHFARTYARRVHTGVPVTQGCMNQYKLMRTNHGSVLFFTQHASSSDRGTGEHVKRFQPILQKTAVTALYIPDEGLVVEQNFPTGKFGIMGTPVALGDNTYMLFLRTLLKSQVAIFKMDADK